MAVVKVSLLEAVFVGEMLSLMVTEVEVFVGVEMIGVGVTEVLCERVPMGDLSI